MGKIVLTIEDPDPVIIKTMAKILHDDWIGDGEPDEGITLTVDLA